MNSKNRIFRAALMVFGFWWIILTLVEFGGSPLEVIQNWGYVSYSLGYWIAGTLGGFGIGVWLIWFERVQAMNRLYKGRGGNAVNGIWSTLGHVPMLAPASPRVPNASQRLPIQSKIVAGWVEKTLVEHPEHAAFFLAVWDVYSAHKGHPATHRKGGHANRRLWEHCLAVTEMALQDAGAWTYEGVHAKKRGKAKRLIIAKRNPEYVFDAADPLVPIIALAHDFGKLEAYTINEDGSIATREEGSSTDHDDDRIFHDSLGARMLARLPEYWKLSARDRRAINLVIGHYHHPSAFPVDENGLAIDDRMSALMEFLIYVDKKTGLLESGRDAADEDDEITEEQATSIYNAFVEVVTEFGRVNGTGDKARDATFKIGQKHDGLIVVKELELRRLILAKLGWSLDEGESRYRVTMNLLFTLGEKGLLYDQHNGIDFARYHPMYAVSFRSSKNGQHISTWEPVIIFKPLTTTPEFAELGGLPNFGSRMVINKPIYTHNPGIRDPEVLRDLVRRAFGDDVARGIKISGRSETKAQTKLRLEKGPVATTTEPAVTPAPAATPAAPTPVNQSPAAVSAAVPATAAVKTAANSVSENSSANVKNPDASAVVAPVDVPSVPVNDSAALSVAANADEDDNHELDASDIPTIGGDLDSAVEDDLPTIGTAEASDAEDPFDDILPKAGEGAEDMGSIFDGGEFADFPSSAAGSDGTPPRASVPTVEVPPEQPAAEDSAASQASEQPLIVDRPGIAIPDADMPNVRKKQSPEKEAAALEALSALGAMTDPLLFGKRTPKVKPVKHTATKTLERLKDLIASKQLVVCGNRNGFNYVLATDIPKVASDIDIEELVKSAKLPSIEPQPGAMMVGVPE